MTKTEKEAVLELLAAIADLRIDWRWQEAKRDRLDKAARELHQLSERVA